jgi:hypothetical protein
VQQLFELADALAGEPPDDQEWREIFEGVVDRIVIDGHDIKVIWKPDFAPLLAMVTER